MIFSAVSTLPAVSVGQPALQPTPRPTLSTTPRQVSLFKKPIISIYLIDIKLVLTGTCLAVKNAESVFVSDGNLGKEELSLTHS